MVVELGWGWMGAQRKLESTGEVSNTLYTGLPKLAVVKQGLFFCPVDSGLGMNVRSSGILSFTHSVTINTGGLQVQRRIFNNSG